MRCFAIVLKYIAFAFLFVGAVAVATGVIFALAYGTLSLFSLAQEWAVAFAIVYGAIFAGIAFGAVECWETAR